MQNTYTAIVHAGDLLSVLIRDAERRGRVLHVPATLRRVAAALTATLDHANIRADVYVRDTSGDTVVLAGAYADRVRFLIDTDDVWDAELPNGQPWAAVYTQVQS